MKQQHQGNEKGFTLVELLVALPIAAMVIGAATGVITQLVNSTDATSYMVAYRQVQNAGYRVSEDGLQAQNITVPGTNKGFPFVLSWTDWDDNSITNVTYSLTDMPSGTLKQLQRQKVTGSNVTISVVARYINATQTSCNWSENVITFNVTATVERKTATRTYRIIPRSST